MLITSLEVQVLSVALLFLIRGGKIDNMYGLSPLLLVLLVIILIVAIGGGIFVSNWLWLVLILLLLIFLL